MRKIPTMVAAMLFFGTPHSAFAQYIGAWDYNTAFNTADFTANDINTRIMEDVILQDSGREPAKAAPSTLNTPSLAYPISKQVRRSNMTKFANVMKRSDPAGGAQAEAIFAGGAVIDQLDSAMRPVGLRVNNVADAYALWWVAAWEAVNNRDVGASRNLYQSVKRQAESALLATPEFASASNAQKQEIAESMLIQAALIDASIDDAAGNSAKQAALAKAVNQGAKRMGLDLTKMTLTEDGFVPRSGGRSDAGDAAGDNSQLAANDDSARVEDASMGNYALYAVAGTGLLAGMFALGKGLSKKG